MLRWLPERSVAAIRDALRTVCPELADRPIRLHAEWVDTGNPLWARSTAFVGEEWVVKFAWSEPAAEKLAREIATITALGPSPVPVRRVHAASTEPVMLVAPFVEGRPVTGDDIAAMDAGQKGQLAETLARVLAQFHDAPAFDAITRAAVTLPAPTPQATTEELRKRFVPMLDAGRAALVREWCDWCDSVLADTVETVVCHGDFHGYNVVVDDRWQVQVVLDLEEASLGDSHYDFRYLPAQEPTLELFLFTANAYEQRTGRRVDPARVLAWHTRTVCGDALWRTEANVALPGGGPKERWIDELAERYAVLRG